MLEKMEASVKHAWEKYLCLGTHRFKAVTQVFGCMREIENTHGILTVDVDKALKPIRPIHHRTDRFGLNDAAAVGLHFCQVGKVGCIGEPRKLRERSNMKRLSWRRARRNLPNRQRADLCPFPTGQWDHRSVRTDGQMARVL
jgi:hypothetical protein